MLIYDLDLPALTKLLKEWKEPAYRAKQIWQGLYQHFYNSPGQFTTLSKPLREKMMELDFIGIAPSLIQDSSDGQTRKTLFKLPDGHLIEADIGFIVLRELRPQGWIARFIEVLIQETRERIQVTV